MGRMPIDAPLKPAIRVPHAEFASWMFVDRATLLLTDLLHIPGFLHSPRGT